MQKREKSCPCPTAEAVPKGCSVPRCPTVPRGGQVGQRDNGQRELINYY